MRRRLTRLSLFSTAAVLFSVVLFSEVASADLLPMGYVSYNVTSPGSFAEFDIINQTGPNSSGDPTWPVATLVSLSNLSLKVDFSDGSTTLFGSSYFTLSLDGLSFDGSLIAIGGANLPIDATLAGVFSPTTVILFNGVTETIVSNFAASILPSSGMTLQDLDLAVIHATPIPEPEPWLLLATCLVVLLTCHARLSDKIKFRMAAKLLWVSILLVIALQSASWADSTSLAIKLNVATAPSTGVAGVTKVNVTGSGFSSATITPANITVSLATSCGGVVSASTPALSTKTVVGSSRVVQFQIPDTLASNTYFVSIKGTDSTGALFASSNCSQIAITTGNPITTCRDITASGNYFLARDLLETQAMTTCLRIHDTRNVQLDCKFKTITGAGSPAISVTNVQGFAITNCTLQTTAGNTRVLEATTSSNGILTRNTIGNLTDQQHFIVYFTSVNNTSLINNTIDAELIQIRSSGNILRSNTLTCPVWMNNAVCAGLISSILGSNNTMDGNQIDGKGGPSTRQNGADDGIIVADESGDILSNNTIRNTWDMGIETVGNIANMQITSNSIASVGVGGIGGWYWNSWSNVTTTNNSVSNAPQLFTLYRIYGLRAQNWDGNGVAGDAAVYFQGNLFSGNRLTNVSVQAVPSAYIPIYNYLNYHNTVSGIPGERIAQKSDFKLNNNTFTQNDFGRIQPPPYFSAPFTTGEIIDGGGNICASPGANYPLVCN